MSISKRAQSVGASGIRRVFELARTIPDPIDLSIGKPDFGPSKEMTESAIQSIKDGHATYTDTRGLHELRDAIRSHVGLSEDSEFDVLVTSGASSGLFLALSITLDPGEQVLVPDPCFSMYAELPRLLNARPVRYPVYPDFKVSVEKLMPFITEKTKAILINSPANPTGAVIDQTALYEIVNFARERNLWVIYDELYDEFVYGVAHAKLSLGYDQSIIINSFSKSHGVPGWRVGFVVASKQAFRAMLKVQQNSIVCAPAPSQYGALLAYEFDHARVRKDYGARRDFVYNELSNKFSLVKPDGAFFAFPEAPGGDASAFCDRCLKHKLLVIPGSVFSEQDTHFRICFSAPKATLEKGVEILLSLV